MLVGRGPAGGGGAVGDGGGVERGGEAVVGEFGGVLLLLLSLTRGVIVVLGV